MIESTNHFQTSYATLHRIMLLVKGNGYIPWKDFIQLIIDLHIIERIYRLQTNQFALPGSFPLYFDFAGLKE